MKLLDKVHAILDKIGVDWRQLRTAGFVILVVLCLAVGWVVTQENETTRAAAKHPSAIRVYYFEDERTGLCYAAILRAAGTSLEHFQPFAEVTCTEETNYDTVKPIYLD